MNKNYIDKMTYAETAADKREFTAGVMGQDKFNIVSFGSGWLAAWLLARGLKK